MAPYACMKMIGPRNLEFAFTKDKTVNMSDTNKSTAVTQKINSRVRVDIFTLGFMITKVVKHTPAKCIADITEKIVINK